MEAWQNKLPLYNLRMSNLSAAIIRPQLAELPRRVCDGLRNHNHVAARLNTASNLHVPMPLPPESRAPDSIQFNLVGMNDAQAEAFASASAQAGLKVQIFGQSTDNARAFWNWQFLPESPDQPITRAMLQRACDVRLPARLSLADCDLVAEAILDTVGKVMQQRAA